MFGIDARPYTADVLRGLRMAVDKLVEQTKDALPFVEQAGLKKRTSMIQHNIG
jgi:hypothetical protein